MSWRIRSQAGGEKPNGGSVPVQARRGTGELPSRAGAAPPVGFDDSAFMNCTDPPLTTVRQPIESMGKAAVALLVNQIENVAVYPEELLFEPELVVRGSTGRPARVTAQPARHRFARLWSARRTTVGVS